MTLLARGRVTYGLKYMITERYRVGIYGVTVMTTLGSVTISAVQVVTAVTHGSIRFQLIMGVRPVGPIRGRHTPGSTEMALIAFD